MKATAICRICQKELPIDAVECPHCHAPASYALGPSVDWRITFVVLLAVLSGAVYFAWMVLAR
jgi:hypothetical protein